MKSEIAKQVWCKYHTLSDTDKDNLFIGFYKLGNYNFQNAFLVGLIKRGNCTREYKNKRNDADSSMRKVSYTYILKNGEGDDVRVFLKSFMDTFSISRKRVTVVRSSNRPTDTNSAGTRPKGLCIENSEKSDQELNQTYERSFIIPHLDKRGRHGHISMPSDSGFGAIEKKARKVDYLFTVDDWKKVVREAR
ncbi:hypothetical protein J6590_083332 [Homalodisca vitripennis]|nr:hypothetical protein J6590_083332 [Homalodisca vitripennis]